MSQSYADQGDFESETEILATIDSHLTSHFDTEERAMVLRRVLRENLESDRFDNAWERGKKRNLNDLVKELLAECEDNG